MHATRLIAQVVLLESALELDSKFNSAKTTVVVQTTCGLRQITVACRDCGKSFAS